MSQENVEILRRWHDGWNRGDLDTVADLFHPDAEVIPDPSWMEPGPFKGRTAIRSWYEGVARVLGWARRGRCQGAFRGKRPSGFAFRLRGPGAGQRHRHAARSDGRQPGRGREDRAP